MLLIISDANVLIDMEVGGLSHGLFELEVDIAVPDILFEEELSLHHGHLLQMGLKTLSVKSAGIAYVQEIAATYRRASNNDLIALALARQERCPLVTGDGALRAAANAEGVDLRGTIWLVGKMVAEGRCSAHAATNAYRLMRDAGSRLPWADVERQLADWGVGF